MAAPSPDDHVLLTTTALGCLEREDAYGDALADIPNIVVFVNLHTPTPLIHCISWYDLRAVLEPPDAPTMEHMRLLLSDDTLPSNYVYRVLDRWFDPSLEPFTRYYNTFLLYDSYEAPIGTQSAVSAIHGATERLHRVRPIHRRDVVDYVRGTLSVAELRARVAATVGGLSEGGDAILPPDGAIVFEPELEDAVRPVMLYRGDRLVLARPFEGKPFGHATEWVQGQVERTTTYDGTVEVERPIAADRRAVSPAEQSPTYHLQVRIPGVRHIHDIRLTENGDYVADPAAPPFELSSEMEVTSEGITYHMRPRVVDDGQEESNDLRVDLHSDPSLDDENGGDADPSALMAFRMLVARRSQTNVYDAVRNGELVLVFRGGPDVYRYDGRYIYVDANDDGFYPALLPPLSRGVLDVMRPDSSVLYRLLLRPGAEIPVAFRYEEATCHFVRQHGLPPHVQALFEENPHVAEPDDRLYLCTGNRTYLVDGDVTYSLRDGNAVYPFHPGVVQFKRYGIIWAYDPASGEFISRDEAHATEHPREHAPAAVAALVRMLHAPISFTIQYAAGQASFHVRRAGERYYACTVPDSTDASTAHEAEITDIPYLLVEQYDIILPYGLVHMQLPTPLPATWEDFTAELQAEYPIAARHTDYMELLRTQYEEHRLTDHAISTGFQLLVGDRTYDLVRGNGLALSQRGRTTILPNLWREGRPLYLRKQDDDARFPITREDGRYIATDPLWSDPHTAARYSTSSILGEVAPLLNRQFPWQVPCAGQFRGSGGSEGER